MSTSASASNSSSKGQGNNNSGSSGNSSSKRDPRDVEIAELKEQNRLLQEAAAKARSPSLGRVPTPSTAPVNSNPNPVALQSYTFQHAFLGSRGRPISKVDLDKFEERLKQADVANVIFKPESFIHEEHLSMISKLAASKYPDWKNKGWREVIKILREVCQSDQGQSSIVNIFRNKHKVEFDFAKAVKSGKENQEFLLRFGYFDDHKNLELTTQEIEETKIDIIHFHITQWRKMAQSRRCGYVEKLLARLMVEKQELDKGNWDLFIALVVNHMREEYEIRLNSRSAIPVDAEDRSRYQREDNRGYQREDNRGEKRYRSTSPAKPKIYARNSQEYQRGRSRTPSPANSEVELHALEARNLKCEGCNRVHHGGREGCKMKAHIDFNRQGLFKDSETKKRIDKYNKNNPMKPLYEVQWHSRFSSRGTLESYEMPGNAYFQKKVHFAENIKTIIPDYYKSDENFDYILSLNTNREDDPLVKVNMCGVTGSALLDSGASKRSYIDQEYLRKIQGKTKMNIQNLTKTILTKSLHGVSEIKQYIIADIELTIKSVTVQVKNIQLLILKNSPYNIIIGLEDIRTNDLTKRFRTWFANPKDERMEEISRPLTLHRPPLSSAQTLDSQLETHVDMNKYTIINKDKFIPPEDLYDPMDQLELPNIWDEYFNKAQEKQQTTSSKTSWNFQVHGSDTEKEQLLALLEEFRDVFATEVSKEPARVTPYHFKVDEEKWLKETGTRIYTRPQGEIKRLAMRTFAKKGIEDTILRTCSANRWAQVHLVAKPKSVDFPWRVTLDYRPLNRCTLTRGWPIPNIKSLLTQIGYKKPKLFCVMDMTSGFH